MFTNLPTILLTTLLATTALAAPSAATCKAGELSCSTTSIGTKEILKGDANGKCEFYAYCYAGQGCGFDESEGRVMCLNN